MSKSVNSEDISVKSFSDLSAVLCHLICAESFVFYKLRTRYPLKIEVPLKKKYIKN